LKNFEYKSNTIRLSNHSIRLSLKAKIKMKLTLLALLVLIGMVNGAVRVKRGDTVGLGPSLVSTINKKPGVTFTVSFIIGIFKMWKNIVNF
jgi:hypothetical protein